jgi:hypothetical protein
MNLLYCAFISRLFVPIPLTASLPDINYGYHAQCLLVCWKMRYAPIRFKLHFISYLPPYQSLLIAPLSCHSGIMSTFPEAHFFTG